MIKVWSVEYRKNKKTFAMKEMSKLKPNLCANMPAHTNLGKTKLLTRNVTITFQLNMFMSFG